MKDQRRSTKKTATKSAVMAFGGVKIKGKNQCSMCGSTKSSDGTKLKRCSGCEMVWFCGAVW